MVGVSAAKAHTAQEAENERQDYSNDDENYNYEGVESGEQEKGD